MTHRSRRTVGAGLLLALVTACSGGSARPTGGTAGRTLTVFAAASLQQAFTAEGKALEAAHPGTRVRFSFAGSQTLVAQIEQGAPADVLATADQATLDKVRDRLTGAPQVFAHNQLALVTAPGNPSHVRTLQDLQRPALKVVLAGPSVPVGKAAAKALAAAGVTVHPASLEDAVTGVVTKVRLGEADAGIAYVTDLQGGAVEGVPLPGTVTSLAIGTLTTRGDEFVRFVLSAAGQQVLRAHGFR
ncbi:MAG: molybdate ABC transporter substrate-binding protein [Mycobacteriales bacterium]